GAAAPRLRPTIGCSLITSKSFATAVQPLIQQTVNAFAARTTRARRCKPGPRGWELGEGGRGFISSERGRSATAPILMRRFFSGTRTFDYFPGNQIIKPRSRQIPLVKQCGPTIEAFAFEHLFSLAQTMRSDP